MDQYQIATEDGTNGEKAIVVRARWPFNQIRSKSSTFPNKMAMHENVPAFVLSDDG